MITDVDILTYQSHMSLEKSKNIYFSKEEDLLICSSLIIEYLPLSASACNISLMLFSFLR